MKTFNKEQRVALIGECMIELRGTLFGALQQSWGGDTYNTAVYLKRLLKESFDVHYLTGLGNDPLSQYLITAWQAQGINTQSICFVPGKMPGLYQISVDDRGERSFQYWRNDAAAKYIFDNATAQGLSQQLAEFGWVYLSGISLAILTQAGRQTLINALELYAKQGGKVVFDNNYRPTLWQSVDDTQNAYRRVMEITHMALLTEDDEQSLWGYTSVGQILANCLSPEVVVKRGNQPCVVRYLEQVDEVPGETVSHVVDTTAAGDSFAAGYLYGRLAGLSAIESVKQGHVLASVVIQHSGAIIPLEAMP